MLPTSCASCLLWCSGGSVQCPCAPVCLFPALCLQLWPQWWSWSGWETSFLSSRSFFSWICGGAGWGEQQPEGTAPGGAHWLHLTLEAELTSGCASTAVAEFKQLLAKGTNFTSACKAWAGATPLPFACGEQQQRMSCVGCGPDPSAWGCWLGMQEWLDGRMEDQDMGWGCFRKYSGRRNSEGKHLRQQSNHCPYLSVISCWLQLAQAQTAARAERAALQSCLREMRLQAAVVMHPRWGCFKWAKFLGVLWALLERGGDARPGSSDVHVSVQWLCYHQTGLNGHRDLSQP